MWYEELVSVSMFPRKLERFKLQENVRTCDIQLSNYVLGEKKKHFREDEMQFVADIISINTYHASPKGL